MTDEMTNEEKLNAVRKIWSRVKCSKGEFEGLSKSMQMTGTDLAILIYDEAKQTGKEIWEVARTMLDDYRKETEAEAKAMLDESGLSRMTKWRIGRLPKAEWQNAIEKARSRSRRGCKEVVLRLVNSKKANKLFSATEGGFAYAAVFSALCSAMADNHEAISFRTLFEILNPCRNWRKADKQEFVSSMKILIKGLNAMMAEDDDGREIFGIHTMEGEEQIVMLHLPQLWIDAQKHNHIVRIKSNMLAGNSHLDWLSKIYLAKRIRLADNDNNKMVPAVGFKALNWQVGHVVSWKKIDGHFRRLQEADILVSYCRSETALEWISKKC